MAGKTLTLEIMAPTNDRWPRPCGEFETLEADVVVQAIRQSIEQSFLAKLPGLEVKDGAIQVDDAMRTGAEGVFAGGDMVPSIHTITTSIGHIKKAARNIDAYLKGTEYAPAQGRIGQIRLWNPVRMRRGRTGPAWTWYDGPAVLRKLSVI
ncbi:MAG: FAD-dependent oxidoreductase [Candidatus Competibacteraceae bacterium]